MVQVYTGKGKGKTTAAVGQIIRLRGRGYKAFLLQFFKKKQGSGEIALLEKLGVRVVCTGGEYGRDLNLLSGEEKERIRSKWDSLLNEIDKELREGRYDLLVLDEINVALHYGFISKDKILSFISGKPAYVEVILTGRYATPEIIEEADLVSEIKEVKHPFRQGTKARRGIEY